MNDNDPKQTVPLTRDADGTFRIGGTRVTLDTLVHQFRSGATAEQIQEDFPALKLSDVYSVIAYYLQNRDTLDDYLKQQQRTADDLRSTLEHDPGSQELRERLRQRRSKAAA